MEKKEIRTSQRGQFSTSEWQREYAERRLLRNRETGEGTEHTLIQDNFISKNLDFNSALSSLDDSGKDFSHCFRSSFDIHGANAEDDWRATTFMEEDLIVARSNRRTRGRSCGNGARPGRLTLWRIQESRNTGLPVFVHDKSEENYYTQIF